MKRKTVSLLLELEPEIALTVSEQAAARGIPVERYLTSLIVDALHRESLRNETRALFARWDAEDRFTDPAEVDLRNREFEEFKSAMNANRTGQRLLFP